MDAEARRHRIIEILEKGDVVSGSELSSRLGVSRQVVVQDIAILRAAGKKILSTPQGYCLEGNMQRKTRIFACKHDMDKVYEELSTIVDYGGKVLDVIVEHPIYGELKGYLMISSRYDLDNFMKSIKESQGKLLSSLTGGVHLHTVEAESEAVLDRIEKALREKGFLMD
ncbi:MAG: transcription repressor NadR [Thermoanaerobacteraceae bacterium]|nr:transcription repressor NadR [Thermoanaerobacteraceae bacterium]